MYEELKSKLETAPSQEIRVKMDIRVILWVELLIFTLENIWVTKEKKLQVHRIQLAERNYFMIILSFSTVA